MIETHTMITTKYGCMPSFVVHPEGEKGAQWPGIIFFMDAPGIREELYNHARRIARNGYVCVLPDMYYRLGTIRLDLHRRDEAMSTVVQAARFTLTNAMVDDDTAAILAFLDAHDRVRNGPVGTIGHCAGGKFVTTTAARFPHRIVAGAALYGVLLVTDKEDSPHRHLDPIKAELYYGFGALDRQSNPDYVAALREALEKAGISYAMDVYPGANHGYFFAERFGDSYASEAAEESWRKIFDLWNRRLKPAR